MLKIIKPQPRERASKRRKGEKKKIELGIIPQCFTSRPCGCSSCETCGGLGELMGPRDLPLPLLKRAIKVSIGSLVTSWKKSHSGEGRVLIKRENLQLQFPTLERLLTCQVNSSP